MRVLPLLLLALSGCTRLGIESRAYAVSASDGGAGPASWVLDCAGDDQGNAPHVNHGFFWTPGAQLGKFAVQAWVMPRQSGSRYWLSDGYGGLHNLLIGFSWDGTANHVYAVSMSSDGTSSANVTGITGIAPGTWVHVTIDWDGTWLRARLNGLLDGKTSWTGPRGEPTVANGGGELFICGSTHSNFNGRVAEVELWEGVDPVYPGDQSFPYERRFRSQAWDGATAYPASFLAVYTSPADVIPDLSAGYNGQTHPGTPFAGFAGEDRGAFYGVGLQGMVTGSGRLPTWVLDSNAPTAQ